MRKARAPFISAILLKRDSVVSFEEYPFCIPAIRNLRELRIPSPVTFLVGENGTGKSTLLEALAVASGFNAEGGSKNFRFSTRPSHSGLHDHIRLVRPPGRPKDGLPEPRPFLTASWRYLALLNYEVPPALLRPLVPAGTELDMWGGATLASIVGFRFLDTRVLGLSIPGHRDFDEINLRFYVRRRAEDGSLAPGRGLHSRARAEARHRVGCAVGLQRTLHRGAHASRTRDGQGCGWATGARCV